MGVYFYDEYSHFLYSSWYMAYRQRPLCGRVSHGERDHERDAAGGGRCERKIAKFRKMASKMSAFLRAKHNNRGDPDHQYRTRPRARYVLALCAAALSSVRATKKYDGKQAEIAENRANFDHRSKT